MSTTTTKKDIKTIGKRLREAAEKTTHRHATAPEMRVGQMYAQGDIGVLAIRDLPENAAKIDRPANGQVAPGTTQGSRHCIDESDAVCYYRFPGDDLSDLCVESTEAWTLRHPEHGHVTFGPGRYQLVHQQNEQRERVMD